MNRQDRFKAWVRQRHVLPVLYLALVCLPLLVSLWRERQPPPLRYLGPGIILNGLTSTPAGGQSSATLAAGDVLLIRWQICNDTSVILHATVNRQFRSSGGHTYPVASGSSDFNPGCNEVIGQLVGVTDELLPNYSWYYQGSTTVMTGSRTWIIPWTTTSFSVTKE